MPSDDAAPPRPHVLDRPIVVVGPPCSGSYALVQTLLTAPGTWDATGVLDGVLAAASGEEPSAEGDRLTAGALTDDVRERCLDALAAARAAVDTTRFPKDATPRMVLGSLGDAIRVPFLADLLGEATFVLLHRSSAWAIEDAVRAWEMGAVAHPGVPGWSLTLVPGWRELLELEVRERAEEQWARVARIALNDVEALGPERWVATAVDQIIAEPENETQRIFARLGLGWHTAATPTWLHAVSSFVETRAGEASQGGFTELDERFMAHVPAVAASSLPSSAGTGLTALDSGMAALLRQLGGSLLVTTYQSNRVISLRASQGGLGVHLREFDRPMGVATTPDGFALGTRSEVLDFRDFPAVAETLDPPGSHDACYMLRNSHVTGDIAVHDLEMGRDGLWVVATAFNCLATLDTTHSFVPRWMPPFVSGIVAEDRCHLNGVALVDGVPRYVTALGVSDVEGGWRPGKATGGVLMEVPSGEVLLEGLSMPHSPRWHEGTLYVLESGRGRLLACDLDSRTTRTVAELPGFTRGLSFMGPYAFVGTSQIRETATFGGLPVAQRGPLQCGVWAVDLRTHKVVASVTFADRVQELFDVAALDGVRHPEVSEPGSDLTRRSWYLPGRG